ncbi:MAG: trypsin-like serine protease [Bacteroidota bacterium]
MSTIKAIYKFAIMLAIILPLVFVTACGDFEEEDPTPNSAIAFGIRHDRNLADYEEVATNAAPYNTADYPDFSAVVHFAYSVDDSGDEYVASGVLVSPEWILTAGHNFFDAADQEAPAAVNLIDVNIGADPNSPASTVAVEQLVFHPTWINQSEVIVYANDLCLVKLSTPLAGVTPATINESTGEPIGNVSWFCGYGDYSSQAGQDPDLFSKRHAVSNILDRKVSEIVSRTINNTIYNGGLVAFDFDSPDGLINAFGDDFTSEDEPLLGGGDSDATALEFEGTTVEGDSGGPLFVKMNNEWRVIGILSGGANEPIPNHRDGSYGDISVFTRVSTAADWIDSVINP